MSIDETNFHILQMDVVMRGKKFASYKYAGKLALRYKLGLNILQSKRFGLKDHMLQASTLA